MNTNTYTIDQLQCMANKMNAMSGELLHRNSVWRLDVERKRAGLKRFATVYSRTVGFITFLETAIGSDEFRFVVMNPENDYVDYANINTVAKYLRLC